MSLDPEIYFDCPHCKILLTVPQQQAGKKLICPKCGQKTTSPANDSRSDETNWMLDGLDDPTQKPDIPDTLKIDGVSNEDDELAWDITCHVCDSLLLVNQQQVGTQVRCNDCHSMLNVEPPKETPKSHRPSKAIATNTAKDSGPNMDLADDDDFLQLAPAVELPSEREPQLEEFATAPAETATTTEDDSDEMIELLDVPPQELNRHRDSALAAADGKADEAPVRVYAKRHPKKKQTPNPSADSAGDENGNDALSDFPDMSLGKVIDRSVAILQSGAILTWAAAAILLMAFGSAFWHWNGAADLDPETTSIVNRIYQSGVGLLFGHGIFLIGYLVLLYVGGVIFRETANGQAEVKSVSSANALDFRSTLLLFGFSMFVAASPWLMVGWMFLTFPFQFFLAGVFLFSAWNNQSPFMIVSEGLFDSFSLHLNDWKRWAASTVIAAFAGIIGGALMEVSVPALSIFTSIGGAILITIATLFYAAATGWHCGSLVQQMRDLDE